MSRSIRLYLQDILESCEKIERYTNGLSFAGFVADDKTFDATLKNLAVIGEAVKRVPPEIRDRAPEIDWRRIAGLRDILAHEYFRVDPEIIWDVVCRKLPELRGQIHALLQNSSLE
jgi:uncharacterized protein with HEPN domain